MILGIIQFDDLMIKIGSISFPNSWVGIRRLLWAGMFAKEEGWVKGRADLKNKRIRTIEFVF